MICFLSGGYNHGGGALTIQLLLFKSFSQIGEKCKLFDVDGGSVHQAFKATQLPFEFIEIDQPKSKKDYSHFLDQDDLLIVFDTAFFNNLLYFSKSKCKLLVWEIFYPWVERFIYTRYFPIKPWAKHQEKKILKLICENNAFFFIDYMGKSLVEKRLNYKIDASHYLPIPIEIPQNIARKKRVKSNITISYVGRSVIWKMNPVIKVLSDLIELNDKRNIKLNLVCDDISTFKNFIQQQIQLPKNISIQYYEKLSLEELNNILTESDMHFAMGTSALDGAKLGIPTILIDASYNQFPSDYRYRWIYESDDLNLGIVLNYNTFTTTGIHTISEVLDSAIKFSDAIGEKCKYYAETHYDINNVSKKILEYKKTATLTMQSFRNLFTTKYHRLLRKLEIR